MICTPSRMAREDGCLWAGVGWWTAKKAKLTLGLYLIGAMTEP